MDNKRNHALAFKLITLVFSYTYLCVFAIGLTVAIFSGVIEYKVFSELMPKGFKGLVFFVVLAFEVFKCYLGVLVVVDPITKESKIERVRWLLILVSLACTMVFCFDGMYQPNKDSVRQNVIAQITQLQDKDVEKINMIFDKQRELINGDYDPRIKEQERLREEEKKNVVKGSFIGQRYNSIVKEIERLEKGKRNANADVENRRQAKLAEVSNKFELKMNQADQKSEALLESGSKLIISTLKILNGNGNVSDGQYILMVVILSLLLTVVIESLIMAVFTLLARAYGKEFIQLKDQVEQENLRKISEDGEGSDTVNKEKGFETNFPFHLN